MDDRDALIIGSGPAATVAASVLAQAGLQVIQLATIRARPRPREILAPAALRLLRDAEILDSSVKFAPCRGVLAQWHAQGAQFHDYELFGLETAWAVDRMKFHKSLLKASIRTGVTVRQAQRIERVSAGDGGAYHIKLSDQSAIATPVVIDARGRANKVLNYAVSYTEYDSLIALWVPIDSGCQQDCLILEHTKDGWWYRPPVVAGELNHIAFLTDADLVRPRSLRPSWLKRRFESTAIIKDMTARPIFNESRGVSAQVSSANPVVHSNWWCVGDAALSLDPLSGSGISSALEGTSVAMSALLSGDTSIYTTWLRSKFYEEERFRYDTYAAVAPKYQYSPFWQRRLQRLKMADAA